jgi:hypothetical protein
MVPAMNNTEVSFSGVMYFHIVNVYVISLVQALQYLLVISMGGTKTRMALARERTIPTEVSANYRG